MTEEYPEFTSPIDTPTVYLLMDQNSGLTEQLLCNQQKRKHIENNLHEVYAEMFYLLLSQGSYQPHYGLKKKKKLNA